MGRVLIAGTNSGCGKTTLSTGLMCALKGRGLNISAFKCGPDYIDPMFHREAIGIPSCNLDAFFSSDTQLRRQLAESPGDISIIEGVMGYYDGIGAEGRASTYTIARATDTPAILVVNARGMYTSAGAIIQGFLNFKKNSGIRGVVFNGISNGTYSGLYQIAKDAGIAPLGFLPNCEDIHIGSRHLGLITAPELADLQDKLAALGRMVEDNIDISGILSIASTAPNIATQPTSIRNISDVSIAVARDRAFCFMYDENLRLLKALGARIIPFSPLEDAALPEGIGGLYLCGGYPELYAKQLSGNSSMLHSIRTAINGGLPTIAECGGYLYLHDLLDGLPMAGVIHGSACRADSLQRFGYATLTASGDNLLCNGGDSIPVHEFHYYKSTFEGSGFIAKKAGNGREYPCVYATASLYAGFPHLYLSANPRFAESFIRKAAAYASGAY